MERLEALRPGRSFAPSRLQKLLDLNIDVGPRSTAPALRASSLAINSSVVYSAGTSKSPLFSTSASDGSVCALNQFIHVAAPGGQLSRDRIALERS